MVGRRSCGSSPISVATLAVSQCHPGSILHMCLQSVYICAILIVQTVIFSQSIEDTSIVGLSAINLSSVALSLVSSILLILRLFLRKLNICQRLFSAVHNRCSSERL